MSAVTHMALLGPRTGVGGNDAFTKLLLHMDGVDASTTFADSSALANVVTANGNAQIDTAQSVFGGASGLFDGTGDYLTVPDSNSWNFGTGDFTIEFRIRFASVAGSIWFLGMQNGGGGEYNLYFSANTVLMQAGSVNANGLFNFTNAWTPSTGTWYHFAYVRNGNNHLMFVDGAQIGSTTVNSASFPDYTSALYIGARSTSPTTTLNGWLDELRISQGIARWTATFTPPAGPYS